MDNKALLAVLEDGENRLAKALRSTDVKDKDYGLMVETLSHVRGLAEAIAFRVDSTPYKPITYNLETHEVIMPDPEWQPAGASLVEEKEPKAAKKAESTPVESAPAEPAEPAETTETAEPAEPKLTRQDMVTQLSFYASDKGGNVEVLPIMQSHGWNNLSAVPPEEYQTLLDEVKAAAGVA